MKLINILALIGLIILILSGFLILQNQLNSLFNRNDTPTITNTSNPILSPISSSSIDLNSTFSYPSNDLVINNINWTSYPNLQTGYVYTVYIAEPNTVISHKFIEVQILTEVKGTENRTIILEQLAGVAREARKIYGPNGSINIIGTKDGIARWFASMLPYDDTIY